MITVAAVVVTRNRPALLKRCLAAIDAQTYPTSHLVVVDNASEQPTRQLLAAEVMRRDASFHFIQLEENTGGAGGFHFGMRACLSLPCTHMWLMDDDCEPDSQALAELAAAAAVVGEDAVLGGNVFDLNGESINVQPVALRLGANGLPQYPLHLAYGLLEMATLTFVSFLVPTSLVHKAGLPFEGILHLGRRYGVFAPYRSLCKTLSGRKKQDNSLKIGGRISKHIQGATTMTKIWQYRLFYRNRIYIIVKYERSVLDANGQIHIQIFQRYVFVYSRR